MPRFVDISVGTKFVHDGQQYTKIADERINCCKVNNAVLVDNPAQKVMIVPANEVVVVQE